MGTTIVVEKRVQGQNRIEYTYRDDRWKIRFWTDDSVPGEEEHDCVKLVLKLRGVDTSGDLEIKHVAAHGWN